MPGKFILKSIIDMTEAKEGVTLGESDFSVMAPNGKFLQFEFEDDSEVKFAETKVKPGLYAIASMNNALILNPTEFSKQSIVNDYELTSTIERGIDVFFERLHVYEELGVDPKRGTLLYGPAGTGKSSLIAKISKKYAEQKDTLVVLWPSDKYSAVDVKHFIGSFNYEEHNVKKFILIIEDLGGVEQSTSIRGSESSLLSLLDNVERTFKVPTAIIATTNYPELFLENLTNRPQRFDDVIEVKRPSAEDRLRFMKFFLNRELTEEETEKLKNKKYDIFSPAHLKEIVIRSKLLDITILDSISKVFEQADRASKSFANKRPSIGLGFDDF